jgi:hypothetical protein
MLTWSRTIRAGAYLIPPFKRYAEVLDILQPGLASIPPRPGGPGAAVFRKMLCKILQEFCNIPPGLEV